MKSGSIEYVPVYRTDSPARVRRRIWIDIDNSPHVPFFVPIIEALEEAGFEVVLTARNMYQVSELVKFFGLPCKVIGGHCGKNTLLKVLYNCARAVQLMPIALRGRIHLAASHGSRAQILTCKLLGIPTIMMHDYEHSTKTGFVEADWIMMPDIIPAGAMSTRADRVLKYPGLKEDVYVPRFWPDPAILPELGVSPDSIIATLRPPASDSHYHRPESDVLFAATVRFLARDPRVQMIVVPRNPKQEHRLRADWPDLISSRRMIIPGAPVNGLNLIWFSDLVISGGGTMNREAAALGVPVYSVFRGKIGAVDEYLARERRLTLIENAAQIEEKIVLAKWDRPEQPENWHSPALQSIVGSILSIVGTPEPAPANR
jgi:predicted glycosyltransferase